MSRDQDGVAVFHGLQHGGRLALEFTDSGEFHESSVVTSVAAFYFGMPAQAMLGLAENADVETHKRFHRLACERHVGEGPRSFPARHRRSFTTSVITLKRKRSCRRQLETESAPMYDCKTCGDRLRSFYVLDLFQASAI
jgi:hypothetical protein